MGNIKIFSTAITEEKSSLISHIPKLLESECHQAFSLRKKVAEKVTPLQGGLTPKWTFVAVTKGPIVLKKDEINNLIRQSSEQVS